MKTARRLSLKEANAIFGKLALNSGARKKSNLLVPKSSIEEEFALHCKASGLAVEREYLFHATRSWRFDFAIPAKKVAIELEGGIWTQGRHNRGTGMIEDMQKYNEAARLGWAVYRFDGGAVKRGEAIRFILDVVKEG